MMKIQYDPWDRFYEKIHIHIQLCQSIKTYCLKITVWLGKDYRLTGKTFQGFEKLTHKRDYGRLSGDAFANGIIIPFKVFSKTSLIFSGEYLSVTASDKWIN